jgi:hypothetical protein
LLLLESNVYRPDAGLYHLPYINLLNEEKIIFGLSNLHFRYAHTSIIQHTSAFLNNYFLGVNGIVIPSALIASAIIINFTSRIINLIHSKKFNLELYFLIFIQTFIFYKMNRYSEFGNDAPSHLLFFFLISKILNFETKSIKQILNLILLILFIIQNKIILIFSIFTIPFFLKIKDFKKIVKDKRFYFINVFFIIWILKNIIVSGCLIFPLTSVCFENFLWSNKPLSEHVSIENEAWAKGWPDYVRENKNKTNKMNIKEYSKKFNWLGTWSKNHLLKILEIILPYIIFLFFLFFYFFKIKKRGGNDKNFADNLNIYILLFLLIISTLAWFIKIPTFRYGYSYPISFISIVFGFMGVRYFDIRDNILKKYLIFLILCFTVLFSKNLIRINGNLNYYTNYPWPKFYSMSEIENKFPELTEINISDKKFYRPSKNNYCMYYKSPCIHYGNYLNAKIVYKNSYTIVYVD